MTIDDIVTQLIDLQLLLYYAFLFLAFAMGVSKGGQR